MAAQGGEEDVYATLLLNDIYLPGALVLAHSLRDAGTSKRLAVLYTTDTVSKEVIEQLKSVYDYGIPVDRIRNARPENLNLMNRPDLHSAFTKVNLWKLTQFRKIVYLDADVLSLRAPDELFNLPYPFSAASDIGWPDLFNTGVMALTPNMGDFHALFAMAERGVSFDGADQGLLNMYFKNGFHRLPFTYNVTPSAHYQYLPAYRHFQSSIKMVHFIGPEKPWVVGRDAKKEDSPYSDLVGRWWAQYDKHYRVPSPTSTPTTAWQTTESQHQAKSTQLLQYFVQGEFKPTNTGEHTEDHHQHQHLPSYSSVHAPPPPPRSPPQPKGPQEPQEPQDQGYHHPPAEQYHPPPQAEYHHGHYYENQQEYHQKPRFEHHDEHRQEVKHHEHPGPQDGYSWHPPEQQQQQTHFEPPHTPPPPPLGPDHTLDTHHTQPPPPPQHDAPWSGEQRSESPQGHSGWQPHPEDHHGEQPPQQQGQQQQQHHHHHHEEVPWHPEHGWEPHHHEQHKHTHHEPHHETHHAESHSVPIHSGSFNPPEGPKAEAREEQVSAHHSWPEPEPPKREPTPPPPVQAWDAQWQPPPLDSKPEAENFPQAHYEMSQDTNPFIPPERYPSPPRDMWYQVPSEPPAHTSQKPRAIFPWESHQPAPSRVFWDLQTPGEDDGMPTNGELPGPSMSMSQHDETSTVEAKSLLESPSTPTVVASQGDVWASFERTNVWDEDPKIQRYARKLEEKHQPRRGFVRLGRVTPGPLRGHERSGLHGVRVVTDFPSEDERPSLPVTPAPIHSSSRSWGGGLDDDELPAAEGVPSQVDWDPLVQLQKLAKQQSDMLQRLQGEKKEQQQATLAAAEKVERAPTVSEAGPATVPAPEPTIAAPVVLSPQPVKGAVAANMVRDMIDRSEEMGHDLALARSDAEAAVSSSQGIPEPSYLGPGAAWERGENVPTSVSPLPPSDEERDIFET